MIGREDFRSIQHRRKTEADNALSKYVRFGKPNRT